MDAGLIEHSPWDDRPEPAVLRMLMGDKLLTYLHGYAKLPNVEKMDGDKILNMIHRLEDYSILQCLYHAIYPSPLSVMGSPKMIHHSKLFSRLFRDYGWQVVPGAKGDDKLWITRYGAGEGGILFVGQAQAGKVESPLEVFAPYFNASSVIFVNDGQEEAVVNEINGDRTLLPTGLDRGAFHLYGATLHASAPYAGNATALRRYQAGVGIQDTIELSGRGGSEWKPAAIPGYQIESVALDGKTIDPASGTIAVPAGEHQVVLSYRREVGISGAQALANLELLKEGKPAFTLVLAKEDEDLRFNARKIASFFTKLDATVSLVTIPTVIKGEELPEGPLLYLGTSEDLVGTALEEAKPAFAKGEVRVKGETIAAIGGDQASLEAAVNLLLDTLSDRYPNYGYLSVGEGSLHASRPRMLPGLFQKKTNHEYLPWKK